MSLTKEAVALLAKAQSEIKNAKLDAKNPHFKSDYATLESHLDIVKPVLNKYTIVLLQHAIENALVTTLLFPDGSELSSNMPLVVSKNDMQGVGSAITYARRYAIASLFMMGAEDDDGNDASQVVKPAATSPKPQTQPPAQPVKKELTNHAPTGTGPSEAQLKRLYAMSKALHWSQEDLHTKIRQDFSKGSTNDLTREEYTLLTSKMQFEIDRKKPLV
jgi:hypothetical protein